MVRVTLGHEFDCSADRFWDVFFSEEYNTARWPALDLDREVLEEHREGDSPVRRIQRVQRFTSRMDVPAVVRKLVKGAIGYTVHNEFDRASGRMEVRVTPGALADKITNSGVFMVEALGPDRCRRTYEGTIEVRVPLLGKKIEQQIARAVGTTYDKAAEFTRTWLREHPPA